MDKNLILVSSIITSLIFFIIPLISNVLLIGNLVYPVNGIGIVKSDSISVYLLGIYSRMRLSELALGILTMLLSFLSKNIFVLYIGIIVGIVQIAQTYYSKSINQPLYYSSVAIWSVWLIIFKWYKIYPGLHKAGFFV